MELLKESEIYSWPKSFRVIGYGDSTSDLVSEIGEIGYEGLQVAVINSDETITPADEDRLLIMLCDGAQDGLEEILRSFYQAGVLTLVIATDSVRLAVDSFDSLSVVDRDEMVGVVRTLMDPVFYQGRINYDFSDLSLTLRGSRRFITIKTSGRGEDRMLEAVTVMTEKLPVGTEFLSLIVRYNEKTIDPPLSMKEMAVFTDFLDQCPEEVEVIWAMCTDDELDSNAVGLSVIASGNNMKT